MPTLIPQTNTLTLIQLGDAGYSRTALRMVPDDPSTTINESNVAAESTDRGKKNQSRVPKKIHEAEREKLKRDQLNELFLERGHVVGAPSHFNVYVQNQTIKTMLPWRRMS
ncbi:hypothetical protein OPV22_028183 [Ensete ventricosum]|uniref:Iron-related transcription factor 3 bHLH domain-containing protein n=1 Tax=Ensete ventricosum TaxID=4639 RepID=A0AAV8P4W2_ENSVE|nr:hypothetical protein OPV22_028183 [Ensete ventricosum]